MELSPLISNDKRRRPREDIPKKKVDRWKLYRFSGLLLTTLGGLVLVIRVLLDGKVSFYGTLLKTLAFVLTGLIFAFDPELSWDARLSYGAPKLFGLITSVITLVGIIINDDEFYSNL